MAANEEDSTIIRDVKAAIRGRNVIFNFFADPIRDTKPSCDPNHDICDPLHL